MCLNDGKMILAVYIPIFRQFELMVIGMTAVLYSVIYAQMINCILVVTSHTEMTLHVHNLTINYEFCCCTTIPASLTVHGSDQLGTERLLK